MFSFDSSTGALVIKSADLTKDQQSLPLAISCVSQLSGSLNSANEIEFGLDFADACRTAAIPQATISTNPIDTQLWSQSEWGFTETASVSSCGPYDYQLTGVSGLTVDSNPLLNGAYPFRISGSNIVSEPTLASHADTYTVGIDICATYGNGDTQCRSSTNTVTLNVANPCE